MHRQPASISTVAWKVSKPDHFTNFGIDRTQRVHWMEAVTIPVTHDRHLQERVLASTRSVDVCSSKDGTILSCVDAIFLLTIHSTGKILSNSNFLSIILAGAPIQNMDWFSFHTSISTTSLKSRCSEDTYQNYPPKLNLKTFWNQKHVISHKRSSTALLNRNRAISINKIQLTYRHRKTSSLLAWRIWRGCIR